MSYVFELECNASMINMWGTKHQYKSLILIHSYVLVYFVPVSLVYSSDAELSSYMLKAETELFCHRFSCMNSEELVKFLKATYRFLCRLQRLQELNSASTSQGYRPRPVLSSISRSHKAYSTAVGNLLHVLNLILEAAGSWKLAVKLYMDYSSCVFAVPFQHALCLVSSRQVMLDRGMAYVSFSNLHIILAAMFEDILQEGIRVARYVPHHVLEDPRMRGISREIHAAFLRAQTGSRSKTLSVQGNAICVPQWGSVTNKINKRLNQK